MNRTYANFYGMLAAACRKNGNGTAVFDGKEKTAYRALKQEAEAVAAYLQNIGVKFGDTVALAVSNSTEFITAYFAVSAIGAVAVPMNTFLKNSEYAYILNDCKARFLFASAGLSKELAGLKAQTPVEKIIWTDKSRPTGEMAEGDAFFEDVRRFPEKPDLGRQPRINDLAHIIYTSGTTGHPKGALISYANLFANLNGIERMADSHLKCNFP